MTLTYEKNVKILQKMTTFEMVMHTLKLIIFEIIKKRIGFNRSQHSLTQIEKRLKSGISFFFKPQFHFFREVVE
jgi:hypothetical protein